MKSFKELISGLEEARLFASYQDAAAAAAPGQKPKLDAASNKYILVREETISEAQVSTKKYSWGTMKTIHHGSDFSIPLHPEHHKAIAKLKDEQEHNFKTEDGKHWTARRKGDDVHFQGVNNGGTTKVPHASMSESYDDNRRGFGKRPREDDEYHVPDPEVKKNKVKKEEVEQVEEQAPVAPVPDKKYIKGTPEHKAYKATKKPINGMPTCEEVELEEANHREFASQGKMHPDMAKHMKTGEHMDYYEPKTGDKVHGKVMKNDGKEVHVKQSHDSYDPKKVGSVHKFKVSSQLDEVLTPSMGAGEYVKDFQKSDAPQFSGKGKEKRRVMAIAAYLQAKRGMKEEVQIDESKNYAADYDKHMGNHYEAAEEGDWDKAEAHAQKAEAAATRHFKATGKKIYDPGYSHSHPHITSSPVNEQVQKADIPAYLRKAKGEKPLELKDLKRKDTISDAENLAKNRGVKEQQEGNMKSYKEFVTEIKMADLPRRSVKGSSYGAQYHDPEGDDDADNKKPAKAADAPKRGRGRPAGSTSGARQQGSAKQSKSGVDYTGYKLHLPNSNK
jgi:hypothetical protein